jgi:hypothetical protein
MKLGRFSLATLLRAVGACGFGMACLMYASAPWASGLYSVALALLVLALIGIASRAGTRRAFWTGFAIAGWIYLLLATGPWFHDSIARRLSTTRLLAGLYPILIPRERQPLLYDRTASISVRMGSTLTSLTQSDTDRLRREGGNVYVTRPGEAGPSLLVGTAQFTELAGSGVANIQISQAEYARISQEFALQNDVFLELPPINPFAGFGSSRPVEPDQFDEVGHALFTLLISWLGGAASRYMYATRAL